MRVKFNCSQRASLLTGCTLMLCGPVFASGSAVAGAAGPDCGFRTEKHGGLFIVGAIASSGFPDTGRYTLEMSKKNSGGISRNMQQGDFSIQPGLETVLSTTAMEAAAEGHVSARLTLKSKRGVSTCTFPQ